MERNKYREPIQNAGITPSSNVWERLNEKLEMHEKKQKNNKWIIIKYAASFIFILSVSFYFFRSENEINVPPITKEQQNKSSRFELETKTLIAAPIEISPVILSERKEPKVNDAAAHEVEQTVVQNTKIDKDRVISNTEIDKDHPEEKYENADKITKISEVTDSEIELLLKNATINLNGNSQYTNRTEISAIDLLVEVEDDLD